MNPSSQIFAFLAAPGRTDRQALILAESIRCFAGRFADSPIWVMVPKRSGSLAADVREKFLALDVTFVPFEIPQAVWEFPFGSLVLSASAAEAKAASDNRAEFLVVMDPFSLVVNEPWALLLNPGKRLGYRPVDHTLIGSHYDRPLDLFWSSIYHHCGVNEEQVFPMQTSVDLNLLRPYPNAGLLVVRPAGGLLARWWDNFVRYFNAPAYTPFYRQNNIYRIFFHQAILAGTVLATLDRETLQELPHLVNYPLHMHENYPPERRPLALNQIITARYDTFFNDPDWRTSIHLDEPVIAWLEARFGHRTGR